MSPVYSISGNKSHIAVLKLFPQSSISIDVGIFPT